MACCVLVLFLVVLLQPLAVFAGNYALDMNLSLKLVAQRVGDKVVGTARISNPSNKPVEVGKLLWDIRFSDTSNAHKDDIRQQFAMKKCGSTQLPMMLAAGAKLECPFTSAANIYGGDISVVAGVVPANAPDSLTGQYTAFDVIQAVQPASQASAPKPQAGGLKSSTYTQVKNSSIPGQDIACNQKDWAGKPAAFCRVCGGRAAVENACNTYKACVAYDMESSACGYLKAAKGPKKPTQGFSSWLKA